MQQNVEAKHIYVDISRPIYPLVAVQFSRTHCPSDCETSLLDIHVHSNCMSPYFHYLHADRELDFPNIVVLV